MDRAALHMPLQAVPISRDVPPGALAGTPGVEANWAFLPALAAWAAPKLIRALT
ncbi:MAG: hypothetical protein M3332_04935 [Actinomycetota bacterium]|nr:hypothetical protein [Actinomycetota bacterium]